MILAVICDLKIDILHVRGDKNAETEIRVKFPAGQEQNNKVEIKGIQRLSNSKCEI